LYAAVQKLLVRGTFFRFRFVFASRLNPSLSSLDRNYVFKIIKRTERVLQQLPDSEEVSVPVRLPRSELPLLPQLAEVFSVPARLHQPSDLLPPHLLPDSDLHLQLEVDYSEAAELALSVNLLLLNLLQEEACSVPLLLNQRLEVSSVRRLVLEDLVSLQLPLRLPLSVDSARLRTSLLRLVSLSEATTTQRLLLVPAEDYSDLLPPQRVNLRILSVNLPRLQPEADSLDRLNQRLPRLLHSVSVSLPTNRLV
jgi:hypothetical protein